MLKHPLSTFMRYIFCVVMYNRYINYKIIIYNSIQDNDENNLFGIENGKNNLGAKGNDKENSVKPGAWTKPKKSSTKAPKPESTVNFEGQFNDNFYNYLK